MSIRLMAQVWESGPASQSERLVLLAIADFANDSGVAFPSMRRIAEKSCLTERGARKVVRRLEEAGWLEVRPNEGRAGTNVYVLTPERGSPRNEVPPERGDTPPGTTVPPPPEPAFRGTIIEPSVEPSYTPLPPTDEFEAFWSIVPRKVGKGQARKAFDKARKVASFAAIFSAMERHAQERAGKDPQYTPHPATWLNGERWLDEAPAPKRSILDEIDRRLSNGLGLSDASGDNHSGHHALSAPIPSAGTPDGRNGLGGREDDCGGGERAHLKLIKPRRFGGNGG